MELMTIKNDQGDNPNANLFKALLQEQIRAGKKITKGAGAWLYPRGIERQYKKLISKTTKPFSDLVIGEIKPVIPKLVKEVKE